MKVKPSKDGRGRPRVHGKEFIMKVGMTHELHRRIESAAAVEGVSCAALARTALEEKLREYDV